MLTRDLFAVANLVVELSSVKHAPQNRQHNYHQYNTHSRCASGCVVECRICNREVAGSNLSLGYFAPTSTQPSIPPGR